MHILRASSSRASIRTAQGRSSRATSVSALFHGHHDAPVPQRTRMVPSAEGSMMRAIRTSLVVCRASKPLATADKTMEKQGPTPIVKIDNMSDPFATVVSVEFGERLGELLETITALKNMGLNIRRAKLVQNSPKEASNVFYITEADTSEKIVKSARLEEIRMTVINSLISSHPESASSLVAGSSSKPEQTKSLGTYRKVVQTTIDVSEAPNGSCSLLKISTLDRPGLLVDIVSVLKDVNLNVVSAEIDTIGTEAVDEFFITYHGEPLNPSMVLLVMNALQYYLSLAEVAKEESY